jgi:predicted phage terminase large subunit-like protein
MTSLHSSLLSRGFSDGLSTEPQHPLSLLSKLPPQQLAKLLDQLDSEKAARAKRRLIDFVRLAWPIVEPADPFVENWHVGAICDHLEAVARGDIQKLLINIPPGHAKSLLVAVFWPAWVWTWRPEWRALFGSYAEGLAKRDSMRTRDLIQSPWYHQHYCAPQYSPDGKLISGWTLHPDKNTQTDFYNTRTGRRLALGVGGKATGERGNCVRGDTLIATECGEIPIADLVRMETPPRVWSADEHGALQLKPIRASRVISDRTCIRVSTLSGRVVHCTHEHRIWTEQGYRRADSTEGLRVSGLRHGGQANASRSARAVQAMFDTDTDLLLRSHVHASGCGGGEDDQAVWETSAVLAPLRLSSHCSRGARHQPRQTRASEENVRVVRHGVPDARQGVLLTRLLSTSSPEESQIPGPDVRDVRRSLSCDLRAPRLLHEAMRGHCALATDAGHGKLAPQALGELPCTLQSLASADQGARRASLCSVPGPDREASIAPCAPRGPRPQEQHPGEPDHVVLVVSHDAPQIEGDTVSAVECGSSETHDVYDIQVADNHNFFANGILVHNCVVVDDPLNATDAYSKAERDAVIYWWDSVMSSRVNNKMRDSFVIIMQRLHEDDLSGHILSKPDKAGYQHLCLPSEYDPRRKSVTFKQRRDPVSGEVVERTPFWEDPRTEPGDLLFPQRYPRAVLEDEKTPGKGMGPEAYAGQHDQRPAPAEGLFFKKSWWRFFRSEGNPPATTMRPAGCTELPAVVLPAGYKFDRIILSADCAFKDTAKSDYVVLMIIGSKGPQRYVLHRERGRFDFVTTCDRIRALCALYPRMGSKYIEDKANGTAVINVLTTEIPGIIPVNPEGGKESRAAACQPTIQAGQVYLPEGAAWLDEFVDETAGFPKSKHDDQVDALTQGLIALAGSPDLARLLAGSAL